MKGFIKISGIVFVSIILLVVVTLGIIKIYSPSYFVPYVISQVEEETNGRYTLSVNSDSLKIHFISMSVRLGKTEFRRDTSVVAYSEIPFLDKFDVDVTFESFNINAFNMVRYLFTRRLVIDEINLVKPEIVIRKNRAYKPPDEQGQNEIDENIHEKTIQNTDSVLADTLAWDEFRQSGGILLPHLKVEHFEIREAYFSFYDGKKPAPIHEVSGLTFEVKGFELTKKSDIEIEDAAITIDAVSSLISKNTARLSMRGVQLTPDKFRIDSLHFGHIVDKYRINAIKGFRASWLDIGVRDIDITGLHPGQFISDSTIFIDKASIGLVYLNLFKDKEDPVINPAYKPLPQEQIRSIPAGLKINTIEIQNADLVIDMEAPTATHPGQITFSKTGVNIKNLTNIPEYLEQDPMMLIDIKTMIRNQVPLYLHYKLKIDSPEDQFWASCIADPFDVRILNGFIGSQFFMEFSSGKIEKFGFEFEGNNKANVGVMDFEYSDLKLQKLQGHEKYLEGRPKTGFFVGIGNLLVPSHRSAEQKNFKAAAIYYEKEYNRDMIHGTIMSMLSGILSSVGFSSKNLEKLQQKAAALDGASTQKSAETVQNKAAKAGQQKKEAALKETKKHEKELKKQEKKEEY